MKFLKFILIIFTLHISGCEKDQPFPEGLIGKWKLVESINGESYRQIKDGTIHQRIFEFTKDGVNIVYDYQGVEIYRRTYEITDTLINSYGTFPKLYFHGNDDVSERHAYYILSKDTLMINYALVESYPVAVAIVEFFKRIK
jgi:hypothetical protein